MKILVLFDPESGDVETENLAIAKTVGPFPDEESAKAWREKHAPWPQSEYMIHDLTPPIAKAEEPGPKGIIHIRPEGWHVQRDDAGKAEHLTTWIEINGVPMHLQGFVVEPGSTDPETGGYDDESIEKIAQAVEPDGFFLTKRLFRRNFVLIATPFND